MKGANSQRGREAPGELIVTGRTLKRGEGAVREFEEVRKMVCEA